MERSVASNVGKVWLVGAGPGDPGLITARGIERIQAADVIVFDRLASPPLLEHARNDAERIDVGKMPGRTRMSQDEINQLLVRLARSGKHVCRLKGGDPFVFGRGGEEALALTAEGISWEVVPGVTSAVAAPAYAGIPVTHRGMAASFTVVTGSEDPNKPQSHVRWDALARSGGTLVLLMTWSSLDEITKRLIRSGAAPDRPAALIEWGTTSRQRVETGTLADIVERAESAGLRPPVAFVVGEVVRLREQLAWFDSQPLFGVRVLVTRTRTQASTLRRLVEAEGAECVEFPAIRVVPVSDPEPLDDGLGHLRRFDWITISSSNGARGIRRRLDALGLDGRAFAGVKVTAVGPATAETVRTELGVHPDLVPNEYASEAVVKRFAQEDVAGQRILVVRSDIGRDVLATGLRELGATVDEVVGYETKAPEDSGEKAREAFGSGIDVTTFTSSSGVDNLLSLLDGNAGLVNAGSVACIGPVTAARARERGLRVDVVAEERSMPALVKGIVEHIREHGN